MRLGKLFLLDLVPPSLKPKVLDTLYTFELLSDWNNDKVVPTFY